MFLRSTRASLWRTAISILWSNYCQSSDCQSNTITYLGSGLVRVRIFLLKKWHFSLCYSRISLPLQQIIKFFQSWERYSSFFSRYLPWWLSPRDHKSKTPWLTNAFRRSLVLVPLPVTVWWHGPMCWAERWRDFPESNHEWMILFVSYSLMDSADSNVHDIFTNLISFSTNFNCFLWRNYLHFLLSWHASWEQMRKR